MSNITTADIKEFLEMVEKNKDQYDIFNVTMVDTVLGTFLRFVEAKKETPMSNTDKQAELKEQIAIDWLWLTHTCTPSEQKSVDRTLDKMVTLVTTHTNKQIVEVLDRLSTATNTYADGEIALFNNEEHIPLSAIEAERQKLKDTK